MAPPIAPVLFLIFGRPSTTEIVFEEIRKAKPSKLFIAADGPRKNKPGEQEKCQAARAIISKVDWDCEVKTLLRDENLGCGLAISGAISWFFEHVEEGIILEDDTQPAPEFFRFCSEMLEHYRNDERVMVISGSVPPTQLTRNSHYSYFFSDWDHIWGWGTWKRAWKYYDYSMSKYPEVAEKKLLLDNYTSIHEQHYMEHLLHKAYHENDKVTWWDIQWGFARKINSGLVVVPTRNMIINLGFGNGATNTTDGSKFRDIKFEKMEFPLRHPEFVMRDRIMDQEVFLQYTTTRRSRIKGRIKQFTPAWFYDFFKKHLAKSPSVVLFDSCLDLPWATLATI
jgi:hypothetical protein